MVRVVLRSLHAAFSTGVMRASGCFCCLPGITVLLVGGRFLFGASGVYHGVLSTRSTYKGHTNYSGVCNTIGMQEKAVEDFGVRGFVVGLCAPGFKP